MNSELSPDILACLKRALDEDIGSGDATTDSIVLPEARLSGEFVAKQAGIISGVNIAAQVFLLLDDQVDFTANLAEGARVQAGTVLARASGSARALLTGERTALNILGRMSGIATHTREFVDAVSGTRSTILDTRKTAPGLRILDKLAVRHGGGQNHRTG